MELDLSPEERRIPRTVLDGYLSDLRMEIADTDRLELREMLEERTTVTLEVLEALEPGG